MITEIDEALPPAPALDVTAADLDKLVVEYFDMQKEKEAREALVTETNKKIMGLEARLATYLTALGRKNYAHPRGTVGIKISERVNLPQTDADKMLFFEWLRSKGIFEKYATVNAQSLQSLYFAEMEAAIKADPTAALTFSLPGIGERKRFEGISKRKGIEQ